MSNTTDLIPVNVFSYTGSLICLRKYVNLTEAEAGERNFLNVGKIQRSMLAPYSCQYIVFAVFFIIKKNCFDGIGLWFFYKACYLDYGQPISIYGLSMSKGVSLLPFFFCHVRLLKSMTVLGS